MIKKLYNSCLMVCSVFVIVHCENIGYADIAVQWEKEFSEHGTSLTPGAVATRGQDKIFIGVSIVEPSNKGGKQLRGSGKLEIWQLGKRGAITQKIQLRVFDEDVKLKTDRSYVHCLVALDKGGLLAVAAAEDKVPHLIKTSEDGKVTFSKVIPGANNSFSYTDIKALGNGRIVLAGHNGGNSVITHLNASGDLIWTKTIETISRERLTNVLVFKNFLICTGWSIDLDNGKMQAVLYKAHKDGGRVIESITFSATPYVHGVKIDDGEILITYSKQHEGKFTTFLRRYNTELTKQGEDLPLVKDKEKAMRYPLANLGDGVAVAGCEWTTLRVIASKKGSIVGRYRTDAMNLSMCMTKIATVRDKIFVCWRSASQKDRNLGRIRCVGLR